MVDTIESEIAVRDGTFARDHVRVNGKPWNKPNLPDGANWSVQFGYELKSLFDPACHNDFEYAGTEDVHSRPARAYRFKTGPDGCFGTFSIKRGFLSRRQVANPPRFGRLLIDEAGGNLIYFESEANDFPKGFRADPSKAINLWDYATINGSTYLLPSGFEVYTGFVQENLWHVVVEYKNHRHFESRPRSRLSK